MSNKIFPTDTVAKTPIVAADLFLLADSADSNKVKDCTGAVINTFVRGAGGSIVMATGNTIGIASGGNITFTDATVDLISLLGAAVKVGNGTPTQAQAAEDLYVEGKLEVDGVIYADAGLTVLAGQAITDGVFSVTSGVFTAIASLTVDDITLNGNAISSAGASALTIAQTVGKMDITAVGEVVINDAGADVDFRVEGDTDTTLLNCDAGLDRVSIGMANPAHKLTVRGGEDAITVAIGSPLAATNNWNGLGFGMNSTSKAAILYKRTSTYGRGMLYFCNQGTADNTSCDLTNERMSISPTEVAINDLGDNTSFRVESDNNPNMFTVAGDDTGVKIAQTQAQDGLFINQDGNGVALDIDTEATTVNGLDIQADTLTTGYGMRIYSNSNDASTRYLQFIHNDHASATGATCLYLRQDAVVAGGGCLIVEGYGTTGLDVKMSNSYLTTGKIMQIYSNSADASARYLLEIVNDNAAAVGTIALEIQADGGTAISTYTGSAVFNESGGDFDFRIESDANANIFFVDAGNDRIGFGTNVPDNRWHFLYGGTAVAFTSGYQGAVFQNSAAAGTSCYVHLISGNTGTSGVCFGDTDAINRGVITYDHNSETMAFGVGSIMALWSNTSANFYYGMQINTANAAYDFVIHGDTNNNMFVADTGVENITINGAAVSANYDLGLIGDGVLMLKETATPTADTNYGKVYCKNTDKLYFQDGAGNEHEIAFAA